MPEIDTTTETTEQKAGEQTGEGTETTESTETTTEQQAEQTNEETSENKEEESKLSHDDALEALKKTRAEAADWRTKFRKLEDTLKEAKTPEQVAEIVNGITAERESAERELVVENVALKNRLPEDLTKLLKEFSEGKNREQIEAYATTLAKYIPAEEDDPDLQGGLRPGSDDDSFDPVAEVQKVRTRRR